MRFQVSSSVSAPPNALTTLCEYLEDYASDEVRKAGFELISKELEGMTDEKQKKMITERIAEIRISGKRDLYF